MIDPSSPQSEPPSGGIAARVPPLFVSTGSTSSDVLLAPVLAELRRRGQLGEVAGLGGMPLREQGVELFFDSTCTSSFGLFASLHAFFRNTVSTLRAFGQAKKFFRERRPGLAIVVDNSGINLHVLKLAHRHGIPTLYFVTPELWSLWPWEVRAVVQKSTVLVPILWPEAEGYRAHGGNVCWLGHPLADLHEYSRPARATSLTAPTIGLFPGSRKFEVQDILPVMREAAILMRQHLPDVRFLMCTANDLVTRQIQEHLSTWPVPVELEHRRSLSVLARSDLMLACAGTVTLEAAMLGVPMVAMYRMHYVLDRIVAYFRFYRNGWPLVALPNRILNRRLVPELVAADVTPRRLAEEGLALLCDAGRRREVCAGLAEVRSLLGSPGAIGRAADLVFGMLTRQNGEPGQLEAGQQEAEGPGERQVA